MAGSQSPAPRPAAMATSIAPCCPGLAWPSCLLDGLKLDALPEGYVFLVPSRSHRFVFVDQAAEDIDAANAWRVR